ncbi:hypothetical protein L596_005084 [Steinernema carpocapsae]|uniref:Hcy-binding domain-containing protein n=1 Tax=Steinernema carpocapsae TaxID=34508 RepID=A0A4U8V1G1_STECR|nr:hypothetical protein L596_005084 [Steinernema carpocapsae]
MSHAVLMTPVAFFDVPMFRRFCTSQFQIAREDVPPMSSFDTLFEGDKPFVVDGVLASSLQELELDVNSNQSSLNSNMDCSGQDKIACNGLVKMGSCVLITDTYHASIDVLMKTRNYSEKEAIKVITTAVDIAKKVAASYSRKIHVVGSIGPYGVVLRNRSGHSVPDVSENAVKKYYDRQMNAMLSTGLESYCIETTPTLKEAKMALDVWKSQPNSLGKNLWISFSCKDGQFTHGGDHFYDVVHNLSAHPDLTAIGINCTNPHSDLSNLENNDSDQSSENTFRDYVNTIPELFKLNVRLFLGCCRENDRHVNEIAKTVKEL